MPKLLIKGANGASFSVICDENVQQQLLSPDAGKYSCKIYNYIIYIYPQEIDSISNKQMQVYL